VNSLYRRAEQKDERSSKASFLSSESSSRKREDATNVPVRRKPPYVGASVKSAVLERCNVLLCPGDVVMNVCLTLSLMLGTKSSLYCVVHPDGLPPFLGTDWCGLERTIAQLILDLRYMFGGFVKIAVAVCTEHLMHASKDFAAGRYVKISLSGRSSIHHRTHSPRIFRDRIACRETRVWNPSSTDDPRYFAEAVGGKLENRNGEADDVVFALWLPEALPPFGFGRV